MGMYAQLHQRNAPEKCSNQLKKVADYFTNDVNGGDNYMTEFTI